MYMVNPIKSKQEVIRKKLEMFEKQIPKLTNIQPCVLVEIVI